MKHICVLMLAALLPGCGPLFPQTAPEVNPFLTLDSLANSPALAMEWFYWNQQINRKEIDFTAKKMVPFYFHQTKFSIDTNLILWVNEIPRVRLSPLRRIDCGGGLWYYENTGPDPGRDFSMDFQDGEIKSRFRLRLEAIMLDSLFLKLSWMGI